VAEGVRSELRATNTNNSDVDGWGWIKGDGGVVYNTTPQCLCHSEWTWL